MNRKTTQPTLQHLRSVLEEEGGPLAEALRSAEAVFQEREVFAPLLVDAERTRSRGDDYALLTESVLEGYLLHFANGRIVEPADSDLRLLAGDFLYAFGLARLAQIGDLLAVKELADVISLTSQAHALVENSGARDGPWELAAGVWSLGVLAIAHGSWPDHEEAKGVVRAEGGASAEHVRRLASARASAMGVGVELDRALIAFDEAVERRLSPELRPSP